MTGCCVKGCKLRGEDASAKRKYVRLGFHSFPREKNKKDLWIRAIQEKGYDSPKINYQREDLRICSVSKTRIMPIRMAGSFFTRFTSAALLSKYNYKSRFRPLIDAHFFRFLHQNEAQIMTIQIMVIGLSCRITFGIKIEEI